MKPPNKHGSSIELQQAYKQLKKLPLSVDLKQRLADLSEKLQSLLENKPEKKHKIGGWLF